MAISLEPNNSFAKSLGTKALEGSQAHGGGGGGGEWFNMPKHLESIMFTMSIQSLDMGTL